MNVTAQPARPVLDLGAFARLAFFTLLPAIAIAGAMGLPLLIGFAGLAAMGPSIFRQVLKKRPMALALLAAFAAWAALSSLWSAWDGQTALKVASVLVLGVLFAAAAAADARAVRLTLVGGLAALLVLSALLALEAALGMPFNRAAAPDLPLGEVNRNPSRGLVVLLALAWPVLAAFTAAGGALRLAAGAAMMLGVGVLSLQFGQLATALGFAIGLIAFGLAYAAPRFAVQAASFSLAVWILVAPFVTPLLVSSPRLVEAVPPSWAARIGIWRYTCERILEQPWIGHGLDAGRAVTDRISIRGLEMRGVPLHPHSASLQIWFDTGLVGAALAASALAYGGWRLARAFAHDKPAAAAAAAVLAMFGFMANVGWSLWQEWWLATLLLSAALVAAVGARDARA